MKTIFRKTFGLALMAFPFFLIATLFGMMTNQGMLAGIIILSAGILSVILVVSLIRLLITLVEIGCILWKGESL